MKRIISAVLFCLIIFSALNMNFAQQRYKSERQADIIEYTVKEGLPITSISSITQTKDGYIWISGLEGTVRFNGYEFEEIGKEFGLSQMQFHYYDSLSNIMYFASPNKFITYHQDQYTVFDENDGYKSFGLPGRYASFIKKDSKGRVWIGYATLFVDAEFNGGLTMFHGSTFTVYDSTSFPLHNATGMFETPYGELIFSSSGKNSQTGYEADIALFKNNTFIKIDEDYNVTLRGSMSNDITSIATQSEPAVDNVGNTWINFSGSGDLFKVDANTSGVLMYDGVNFHQYPGFEKYLVANTRISSVFYLAANKTVYATLANLNGEKYASSMNLLFKFDGEKWVKVDMFSQTGKITNYRTNETVENYRFTYSKFIKANNIFPDLLVIGSVQESAIGTQFEQYFYYDNGWKKYDATVGFPAGTISGAAVLITTRGFSLYYPNKSLLLTENNGLLNVDNVIPSMYSDRSGLVWINHSSVELPSLIQVNREGVNVWDGKKLITLTTEDGLSDNLVYSINEDTKGRVLAATQKGLSLCRVIKNSQDEWVIKAKPIFSSDGKDYGVSQVLETKDGSIYSWQNYVRPEKETIPKTEAFYGKFDGEKLVQIQSPLEDSLINKYPYQFLFIRELPNGNLLLEATLAEVNADLAANTTILKVFDGENWSDAPDSWNVPEKHLKYVGTIKNTLYYLSPGHFYSFNGNKFVDLSDSVNENADFRILKEASSAGTTTSIEAGGYLYIRVRLKGLVIFDGTNLNFYTTQNGLPTANIFNPMTDKKGNAYFAHQFGGLVINGEQFNVYFNEDINEGRESAISLDINDDFVIFYTGLGLYVDKENGENSAVKISSILVNNDKYFHDIPSFYDHDKNSFLFNYTSLNFKHTDETTYQHILEGYDLDWSRLSNLQFTEYQNLPPGKYNFKVRAAGGIDEFSNEATFSFVINPPIWRTWWAYAFYLIVFIAFLYTIRKFELKRQQKNSSIKESQLRAEAAEAQSRAIESEHRRKTQELEEARKLQLSMLPLAIPQLPNLDIAVYMKTATEVGGDYYDFHVHLDGTLTALLGDATGHGMQSGMMVSIMKTLFMSDRSSKELKPFYQNSNVSIKDMKLGRLMMALTCVQFNSDKIRIANAGMPSVLIYRNKAKKIDEIAINNLPLGAMKEFDYDVVEESISAGDTLLMMSDGFPELKNRENEMLGYTKTRDYFEEVAERDSKVIVDYLKNKGLEWNEGIENDDDVTFVVIKVK